ncbi:hypothetical protein EXIGLDRAFT_752727 [Exidia glandulosa HHB12029]|uniref:Uncharacterized protein n=1 Tax=Exidia glandulosa HHB12029 TaxID=1314781 RepID=A0A165EC89_EXIGL|nr:hypothetical protein EXIGLDRAFT_752727 [Exidia glandulosa HHB12029]
MLRAYQAVEPDAGPTRLFSKTPARATLQTKSLLKSENKARAQPQTSKRVALVPHTPAVQPSAKKTATTTNRGALQDKTPHVNRLAHQTPAPGATKKKHVAATPFQPVKEQQTPPSSQSLPSATRTRVRVPSNAFETPLPSGNHWDISDGSIDLQPSSALSASLSSAGIVEEDFDDIEYMPPTAVESQYEPSFDMPNYTKLGSDLKNIAHIVYFEDETDWDPHANFDIDDFVPPSPTTPTLLSCTDTDDDSDLFPNVKRIAPLPLPPPKPLARMGRPPAPSSRPVATTRPSRPTVATRPSVVPARAPSRAPSRAPARPTAPTPGAGAGRSAAPLPRVVSRPRPAPPPAPAPARRPVAPPVRGRVPPGRAPTALSKTRAAVAAGNKTRVEAVEIVIAFDDDKALALVSDDFVLPLDTQ